MTVTTAAMANTAEVNGREHDQMYPSFGWQADAPR
jgi:hypothetical protein